MNSGHTKHELCIHSADVTEYLHSIMFLRNDVRNGNSEGILTGIHKFSTLFYVRRHPQYQRIIAVNKYILGMMPDTEGEITEIICQKQDK